MEFFDSSSSGSYCTSVRLMKADVMIAKALGVKLTKAFQLGLKILVDLEIEKGTKTLDPALLDAWKSTRENEIEELTKFLSQEKTRMQTVSSIIQNHKKIEEEKAKDTILVWDIEFKQYQRIPESIFNPQYHIRQEEAKI